MANDSNNVVAWRIKPELMVLFQGAADIRGWDVARLLEEGATRLAYEITADAARAMGRIRRANRKARSRKAAATRKAKAR